MAGAAGATALNAVTSADMVWRARAASDALMAVISGGGTRLPVWLGAVAYAAVRALHRRSAG